LFSSLILNFLILFFFYLISYLPRETIEPLFASLFELIGYPTAEQCGGNISQRQIIHLIEAVDRSTNKILSRSQFINITNTDWIDQENGVGTLLIEHSC